MLFQGLLALMVAAVAEIPAVEGFSCTVESAVNASIGEPVAVSPDPIVFRASELERDGDLHVQRVWREDTHRSEDTTHSIDARTGRYEAVSIEKLHDWGEEHLIRRTGTCTPVAKLG